MTHVSERNRTDQRGMPDRVRQDFPILRPGADGVVLAYLDNAATTQKPRPMLDAIVDYYTTTNSNIGRGYYGLSMASTDRFEQARTVIQRFVGAEHPDEIIFTSGTTAATNLLAATLGPGRVGPGDQVVVTDLEHNTNLLPWRRLCEETGAELVSVPVNDRGHVDLADATAAVGPRTRLVALAHVSNVLGTVNPVREIAEVAHRYGVPVVVDGAQAVAHWPIDVRELGVDAYCFSGHKMYGPMGIGVLYARRDLLRDLPPYQVGGGTVKGVSRTEPVRYVPAPARWEAGTPNVAGAVGLAAAVRYLGDLGWETVRRHDETLVRTAVAALSKIDRVEVIGDPTRLPSGIVSFVVDGIHPYDVGGHLDRHGIAVRCGVHCASTFLDSLGLLGTVRMSFAVYNTEAEIDRVRQALTTLRPGSWTTDHPTTRFL